MAVLWPFAPLEALTLRDVAPVMADTQPTPPQPTTGIRPFVTIAVLENGQIQSQTNLKDKALILGLLETAKFQVMLSTPDNLMLHKPQHDGFAYDGRYGDERLYCPDHLR